MILGRNDEITGGVSRLKPCLITRPSVAALVVAPLEFSKTFTPSLQVLGVAVSLSRPAGHSSVGLRRL